MVRSLQVLKKGMVIYMAKLSNQRKATYYIGMGMTILGFLLFISMFFSIAGMMNRPVFGSSSMPSFSRPIIGMLFMIGGQFLMRLGARGAAGSGMILDPDRAREDFKPYTEAAGGMINDVIENIDSIHHPSEPSEGKDIIKVRCLSCGTLNDEDAKFCKSCGKEI
jgi:hypothetical protein